MTNLETAAEEGNLRRVAIDPVSRVEGHGKVTLLVDDQNRVQQARLHIVEFRGFEKFIQGRPYWEVPVLVQRLCGICPVSHHLAAAKAIDQITGAAQITEAAEKIRRLLHFGQVMQSHALHFFHLASPDLLFGFESDIQRRNIIGVIESQKDVALKGIHLRRFGQQVIETLSGKRIHGTLCLPGGVNKSIPQDQSKSLLAELGTLLSHAEDAVSLARDLFLQNQEYHREFGTIASNFMGMIGAQGELELYHGNLRLMDAKGGLLEDQFDYQRYADILLEEVKPWTYMKFPHYKALGAEKGWYRVGPLARLNVCSFIDSPRAEARRLQYFSDLGAWPAHSALAFHWARMIELLHCLEKIEQLLLDPAIASQDLMVSGIKGREGIGAIEAPRGTLFHHYKIGDDDLIEFANLIVSTTNNNQAMNESIRQVARTYLDGKDMTEAALNQIEVAIRAYDPCLSCATHAMGKMPLILERRRIDDTLVDTLIRNADGSLLQA